VLSPTRGGESPTKKKARGYRPPPVAEGGKRLKRRLFERVFVLGKRFAEKKMHSRGYIGMKSLGHPSGLNVEERKVLLRRKEGAESPIIHKRSNPGHTAVGKKEACPRGGVHLKEAEQIPKKKARNWKGRSGTREWNRVERTLKKAPGTLPFVRCFA